MALARTLQLSFFARSSDGDPKSVSLARPAGGPLMIYSSNHRCRVQRRERRRARKLAFAIWDRWTALERSAEYSHRTRFEAPVDTRTNDLPSNARTMRLT